jgi:hypothetical protein
MIVEVSKNTEISIELMVFALQSMILLLVCT